MTLLVNPGLNVLQAHHQHHVMEVESFQEQLAIMRADKARVDELYSQSQQQVRSL